MKVGETIATSKNKKIEQLISSVEGLRLELATTEQRRREDEEALKSLSLKYSQLEEEHTRGLLSPLPSPPLSSRLLSPLRASSLLPLLFPSLLSLSAFPTLTICAQKAKIYNTLLVKDSRT